jgi:hypothetical protein
LINGKYHRRLNLQGGCLINGTASFIEGIGSTMGLLELLIYFESGSNLICAHNYSNTNMTIFPDLSVVCDSSSIGIMENPLNKCDISIYPMPFESMITFEFTKNVENMNLNLYDVYSRLIYSKNISSSNKIIIQNIKFSDGIYFYTISSNNNVINSGKIIKTKK